MTAGCEGNSLTPQKTGGLAGVPPAEREAGLERGAAALVHGSPFVGIRAYVDKPAAAAKFNPLTLD